MSSLICCLIVLERLAHGFVPRKSMFANKLLMNQVMTAGPGGRKSAKNVCEPYTICALRAKSFLLCLTSSTYLWVCWQ
jgi:hypothetical protein